MPHSVVKICNLASITEYGAHKARLLCYSRGNYATLSKKGRVMKRLHRNEYSLQKSLDYLL